MEHNLKVNGTNMSICIATFLLVSIRKKKTAEDGLYNERKLHVPEEGSGVKCILAF